MKLLGKIYRIFIQLAATPIFLSEFFEQKTGKDYKLGFWQKLKLLTKMIYNNTQIISGSSFIEHVAMATSLLKVPRSQDGCVIECGTYKGVSATNLSLICKIVNRKLHIFDSFEGLPTPSQQDQAHWVMNSKALHTYRKGTWCGPLDEVRDNIKKYGNLECCEFHKGYFNETLPSFKEKCVQIFVDVDLVDSLIPCVKYLWPLLCDGGIYYTHEAQHMEIATLFYSESWWQNELNIAPPGLVGAGSGIGIKILTDSSFNSSLGYTIKNPNKSELPKIDQVGGLKLNLGTAHRLTNSETMYTGKEDASSSAAT